MVFWRPALLRPVLVRAAALGGCLALTSAAGVPHDGAAALQPGLHDEVAFDRYSPLSRSAEILHRMLSPLAERAAQAELKRLGAPLAEQPVDLARERFVLYIPAKRPLKGYGLMVFVPPSEKARLPDGWASVLDRYGVIFVSPDQSGNDQSLLGRRAPLALIAAKNVMDSYPVDPERVYVAGFSGGSRVALKLALDYPDLFTGAILNSGSDPIGVPPNALPSRALLDRFQQSTRLVYISGDKDLGTLQLDAESLASMRKMCVSDVMTKTMPDVGHAVASPEVLGQAFEFLLQPRTSHPAKLEACRAELERDVAAEIGRARSLVDAGRREEARKALIRLDASFGGLAAPVTLDLAKRCECGLG